MRTLTVVRVLVYKDEGVLGISFAVFDCELCAFDTQFVSRCQCAHSLTAKCFLGVAHSLTPVHRMDFSLLHRGNDAFVVQRKQYPTPGGSRT